MPTPLVSIIVAHDDHLGIGKKNQLLCHLPSDLKRFKKLTIGHPVIMGRITFESIGRPLPGRTNIVITRRRQYSAIGCQLAGSLSQALTLAAKKDNQEIFIIGGGQIYRQALPLVDKLYITHIQANFQADVFFPGYQHLFKLQSRSPQKQENNLCFTYLTYTKQT